MHIVFTEAFEAVTQLRFGKWKLNEAIQSSKNVMSMIWIETGLVIKKTEFKEEWEYL